MWFDIICGLIVLVGFVFGYKRGFIAQVGSIAGVVFGIVGCNLFASRLAAHFSGPGDTMETQLLANVMSYVIIFAVCYIGGRLLGNLSAGILKVLHLGVLDRLCGAVFTMLEYALVFSILLNAWVSAFPNTVVWSDFEGVKLFVFDLAPTVLGSVSSGNFLEMMNNAVKSAADTVGSVAA